MASGDIDHRLVDGLRRALGADGTPVTLIETPDTVGELAPGCRADLCVVDDHGQLLRVMQAGSWVLPRMAEEVSSDAGRTT